MVEDVRWKTNLLISWWLIPSDFSEISGVNPFITRVTSYLVSGRSHQVHPNTFFLQIIDMPTIMRWNMELVKWFINDATDIERSPKWIESSYWLICINLFCLNMMYIQKVATWWGKGRNLMTVHLLGGYPHCSDKPILPHTVKHVIPFLQHEIWTWFRLSAHVYGSRWNSIYIYHTKLRETLPLTGWYVDAGHNLCQS